MALQVVSPRSRRASSRSIERLKDRDLTLIVSNKSNTNMWLAEVEGEVHVIHVNEVDDPLVISGRHQVL
jgi:hypothetical protein